MTAPSPRAALGAYVSGYEALTSHIYTLFDKYKAVYNSLAMDAPETYRGMVTPTVANFDGLTGTILLADGTRVTLYELEHPDTAAADLFARLAEDIDRQAGALARRRAADAD
jgi:hypothetical protein